MPIEGAAYSNCDSLKPHSPSRTASQSKYNPPVRNGVGGPYALVLVTCICAVIYHINT